MKFAKLIQLFLGVFILSLIIFKLGINDIINVVSKMNLIWLIPVLIILFATYLIGAYNLKIMSDIKIKVPYIQMLKYYTLSWAMGLIAPGKIGEFSIAYYLKKHGFTIGEGISVSLIDKIITVFCVGLISILGFFIFLDYEAAAGYTLLVLAGFVIILALISNGGVRKSIRHFILKKYESHFTGFYKMYSSILKEKKIIIINIFATFLKWFLGSVIIWLLFISLGIYIPLMYVVIISSITVIVSLMPITLSGLGTREAAALYLYGLQGVDYSLTISIYLIMNAINYFIAGVSLILSKYKLPERYDFKNINEFITKILKKRNLRRAKKISKFIMPHIKKNSKILDIGTGNGLIAEQIKRDCKVDIIGMDVVNYNIAKIPFQMFDGKSIPFKNDSFDYATIIEVLHHCDDQENIILESKRIAKKIIILEDVYVNIPHLFLVKIYDYIANVRHGVNIPFNFRNDSDWKKLFDKFNLKIEITRDYPSNPFYSPVKTRLYVLKKL